MIIKKNYIIVSKSTSTFSRLFGRILYVELVHRKKENIKK